MDTKLFSVIVIIADIVKNLAFMVKAMKKIQCNYKVLLKKIVQQLGIKEQFGNKGITVLP